MSRSSASGSARTPPTSSTAARSAASSAGATSITLEQGIDDTIRWVDRWFDVLKDAAVRLFAQALRTAMGQEIDLLVNYPRTKRNVDERGQTKSEEDRAVARTVRPGVLRRRPPPRLWRLQLHAAVLAAGDPDLPVAFRPRRVVVGARRRLRQGLHAARHGRADPRHHRQGRRRLGVRDRTRDRRHEAASQRRQRGRSCRSPTSRSTW